MKEFLQIFFGTNFAYIPFKENFETNLQKGEKNMKKEDQKERYTILIIDDEIGPRESLRILFKNKYDVITAENGFKGLEILKSQKVDIVILDLKMPQKNGIEVLSEIRQINKNVPVIILTGYGDMESAKKAMQYDIVGFVSKPFEIIEIEELVENGIEKGKVKIKIGEIKEKILNLKEKIKEKEEEIKKLFETHKITEENLKEIKKSLEVVQNYAESIFKELSSETQQFSLKELLKTEEEIETCFSIIENIIELSIEKEFEEIDVNKLIENIVSLLKIFTEKQNIEFETLFSKQPLKVKGNFYQLNTSIISLLLEYIRELKNVKQVIIETSKTDDSAKIKFKLKTEEEEISEKNYFLEMMEEVVKRYHGKLEITTNIEKEIHISIIFPIS